MPPISNSRWFIPHFITQTDNPTPLCLGSVQVVVVGFVGFLGCGIRFVRGGYQFFLFLFFLAVSVS